MTRPSSLPALKHCQCFQGAPSAATEAGTDRHAALAAHFGGDDSLLNLLPDEDADGVRWAAEYIRLKAPLSDYPIAFEVHVDPAGEFGELLFDNGGTADAICGPVLFDLKWRERDYSAQMAAYRLAKQFDTYDSVEVNLLFGAFQRAESYRLTRDEALGIVEPILESANNPNRKPNPCDYCDWCANKVTCPALNEMALAINEGRPDWKLENYHPSEVLDPREMAKGLTLALRIEPWVEAWKHYAKLMVLEQGVNIPGYELRERAGNFEVTDINGAFNALNISSEKFLGACKIAKGKLEEIYAAEKEISKAAAKREVTTKLAPYGARKKPTYQFIKSKE